jgi:hypothetical protein
MTYNPQEPKQRHGDHDGLGPGIVATAALAVLAIAGIAFYVVSTDRTTISATDKPSAVENRTAPSTTGQGGASPELPRPDPDPGR